MGVYLSSPKTTKESEDGDDDRLRFGASSMQGWRSTMEDAHATILDLDSSTAFFGVYDGHGGKSVAKFCAKYLHQQVLKQEAYLDGDLCAALRNAFLRMDEMMCGERGWRELATMGDTMDQINGRIEGLLWSRHGHHSPHKDHNDDDDDDWLAEKGPHSDFKGPKYGSTACVALIRNNQLFVANAGDSRCVISRNGQAFNLSKDHKPELRAEKERILKAGGYIHCGRVNRTLNLARAIGDMELKRDKSLPAEEQIVTANPDLTSVELDGDDEFLVIACDGIWDCMSSQELVDFVREQLDTETKLSVVIERVFDKCIAPQASGAGCDNMTMILVQFKNSSLYVASMKEQQPRHSNHQSEADCSPSEA